jgi:hypothetical protein
VSDLEARPRARGAMFAAVIVGASIVGTAAGGVSATTPPNDPELEALLLTVDDLPTGWAIESFGTFSDGGDDDGDGDECGSDIIPGLGDVDDNPTASVDFSSGGELPEINLFSQLIIDVGDGDAAEQFIEAVPEVLSECPLTVDDEGAETSVSEMSFPDLGDASIAYEISVSAEDVPFTLTGAFAMIAVGDRITVLFGLGEGAEGEFLEEVATTAVDRLD